MTRQEAQKRNLSIMQFRGMYNRINKLIPDDIRDELSNYQIEILEKAAIARIANKVIFFIIPLRLNCFWDRFGNIF